MITYPPEIEEALILNQDRFAWEAPSRIKYSRGSRWYLFMSLAAVFLVAYAVWTANFLFAFIILLIAIILVLAGNEDPSAVLAQVGDNGIVWNGRLYLFQDIDNFAVVYRPPVSKILYLELKNPLKPRLNIPLEDQNPIELRAHLQQYIKEDLDLQSEHLSDILARLLKI